MAILGGKNGIWRPIVIGLVAVTIFDISSVCSQNETISAAQFSTIIKDSNLKISATNTTVVGSGPAVTVLADESANSVDQDLKIDAVFLSKALIEAAPNQVKTVKVLFSQEGKPGRYLSVNKEQILEYGSGKVSATQLLAALKFRDVEVEKAPSVEPGLQFDHRLLTWKRINRLKQSGTGVQPFEAIFQEVERLAKTGDANKLEEKLAYLDNKLAEQEEQISLIRKAARGLGVPASATSQSSSVAASNALPASAGIDPVPSDAHLIRRHFTERADEAIRQTDARSGTSALHLRALKQEIDENFSNNHPGKAFTLIREFQELVKQQTGVDILKPPDGGPPNGHGGPAYGGPGQGDPGYGVPGQGGREHSGLDQSGSGQSGSGQGGPGQGGPGQGGPGQGEPGQGGPGQGGPGRDGPG